MPARVPPRGERLAHTASSRFHNDGRPYVEDDQRSSEDEVARRRRRRRARQAKTREGGETQSESESGSPDRQRQRGRGRNAPQGQPGTNAASLTEQLARLCTLPSPGAAQLVADLQATVCGGLTRRLGGTAWCQCPAALWLTQRAARCGGATTQQSIPSASEIYESLEKQVRGRRLSDPLARATILTPTDARPLGLTCRRPPR